MSYNTYSKRSIIYTRNKERDRELEGGLPKRKVKIGQSGMILSSKSFMVFLISHPSQVIPFSWQIQKTFCVFTLLLSPSVPAFSKQSWKVAGENVQIFPAPGQQPPRESKVRTRGLSERLQGHHLRQGYVLTPYSIPTPADWLRMGVGSLEETGSRKREVWWKEQKPRCLAKTQFHHFLAVNCFLCKIRVAPSTLQSSSKVLI